jgi:hypothetical protein
MRGTPLDDTSIPHGDIVVNGFQENFFRQIAQKIALYFSQEHNILKNSARCARQRAAETVHIAVYLCTVRGSETWGGGDWSPP